VSPAKTSERAWTRDTLSPSDWVVPLPADAVAEIEAVVQRLRSEPLPTLLLSPGQFALPRCREVMSAVGRRLRDGIGLAVLDRVPVERFSAEENRAVGWLLGSLLGRLVAQKWDGAMLYDVRDTGKALSYGVRRSVTNLDLQFHTDAPWLAEPPELVGLLCVNRAPEGGVSRFVSLVTAHDEIERRDPALLQRLHEPFAWDRQAEHAPDDDKVAHQPVFETLAAGAGSAGLRCRYNHSLVENAQELTARPLDDAGREALSVMSEILNSPALWVEFTIERGQLQYLNNRLFAHSRTPFRDAEEPDRKRHLIRLWNRDEGRQTFHA
jgi:alpha-ketoglutarate-dependent taurine dioxygenase